MFYHNQNLRNFIYIKVKFHENLVPGTYFKSHIKMEFPIRSNGNLKLQMRFVRNCLTIIHQSDTKASTATLGNRIIAHISQHLYNLTSNQHPPGPYLYPLHVAILKNLIKHEILEE